MPQKLLEGDEPAPRPQTVSWLSLKEHQFLTSLAPCRVSLELRKGAFGSLF